jgi:hypothetical protein
VMMVNLISLVASLTWAPLLVLPLVTAVILWHGHRVPPELVVTVAGLAVAFVLFWPAVSERSAQQGVSSVGQGLTVPQTFDFRIRHWQEFFLPALADHIWLGTGTVIPSQVPPSLTQFVDNEYLREGFRAGLAGLTLLLGMLATITVVGWRCRSSPDPIRQVLGGTSTALAVFFLLVGLTGEYLFFGGVSQEFAMLLGLLGAAQPLASLAPIPALVPARPPAAARAWSAAKAAT